MRWLVLWSRPSRVELLAGMARIREKLSGLDEEPCAEGEVDEAIRRLVGGNRIVDEFLGERR